MEVMMSDKFSSNKKNYLNVRISELKKQQLKELAQERNESLTSVVESAIDMYLTKDIKTESLVFASLENLRRKIDYIDKKLEVFFNFYYFSLTTIIAGLPDLKSLDPNEANAISKNAITRRDAMFEGFKKQMLSNPSAFERLLSDYIEQVNEV